MADLKNHPGMFLRDDAAAAINALEDKYGVIIINRAGVTEASQQATIDQWDRGDRAGFAGPPARPARESNHVKNGGQAVDVYNYTSDRAKLEEFGFEWYGNSDKVHYTFRGWAGAPASAGDGIGQTTALKGREWVGAIQDKYRRMGHDLGPAGIDFVDGPRFVEITKWEQRNAGLVQDGIAGDKTNAYLDSVLNPAPSGGHVGTVADLKSLPNTRGLQKVAKLYGYTGGLDNDFGSGSQGGLQAFLNQNYSGSLAKWLRTKWGYTDADDLWGPNMAAAATRADTANWAAL